MTKALRNAIEALLEDEKGITTKRHNLRRAYEESLTNMTETSKRIEFLESCLETGVSKREAARMLVTHDPRIGQKTAETLVYFNFSGRYQTTKRGRRYKASEGGTTPIGTAGDKALLVVADIEDDESIL